jgi:outer membrane autotransporter protein
MAAAVRAPGATPRFDERTSTVKETAFMTMKLPGKRCAATNARVRKTALVGAAATALIAATPALHAATPGTDATTLQAAVRNALRSPLGARLSLAALREASGMPVSLAVSSSIDFTNSDDITVGPDQVAIPLSSTAESISIVNTGDLTGGFGIDVYTGAIDLDTALVNDSAIVSFDTGYVGLYDDAGNRVYNAYGYPAYIATGRIDSVNSLVILPRDPAESTITIDNRGSIDFADRHAIRAINPAGQSIDIANTGDITSTADSEFRSGIYARTEVFERSYAFEQTAEGELTYNSFGQVTGVVSPDVYTGEYSVLDMEYDGGSIAIENSGNIDMGTTAAPPVFGGPSPWVSVGIQAVGDGGTTILNSGDIKVDRWSSGIDVRSTATTSIRNTGRIDVGNYSAGISFSPSGLGPAGDYRLAGDIQIVNSGEIHGGVTKAELAPGEAAFVSGINVISLGSNNEYLAGIVHTNELFARYNEILGEDVYPIVDLPKARLYDTTVVNEGRIELADGAAGIFIIPRAGDSTAINSGTIIVGEGTSIARNNIQSPSAGIFQTNFSVQGLGLTESINTETGVIVTGDDGAGIRNMNIGGTSIAINEGSITVGNGTSTRVTNYSGESYDRLFQSSGITSFSVASSTLGATAYAGNSGEIVTGDLSFGIVVSGQGSRRLDPTEPTAIILNEGIVTTGDNSSGLFGLGNNVTTINSGSVTIGDLDLSAFQPHPVYTADEFAQQGFGIAASGNGLSEAVNYGQITTGDGTVGAAAWMNYAGYGYAAQLLQGEEGTITTGDDAIGALVVGNYAATLVNEGRITVGRDSVGVDVTAGSVNLRGNTTATVIDGALFASNAGIIETGDASVGLRMRGVIQDAPYSGEVLVFDPPGCSYFQPPCDIRYELIEGTADIEGVAYLVNSGTIRTGSASTAVEITGRADEMLGAQLFNTGTIQAGVDGSGTAIRINADNDLDSYVVNVGTIGGSIVFGDGNDTLVNTQLLDSTGLVTSTGNLALSGAVIDFGAGDNRLEVDRGLITLTGGDSRVIGADAIMTLATIEARNGVAGSTLTFDGNLSGSLTFGTDLASGGDADRLFVGGDVTDGSSLSFVLNPLEQLKGDVDFTVLTVDGDNAGALSIAGVTGQFADSLLSAEVRTDEATGEVQIGARFGMGHMAIAAASATTMAQSWWLQSVESFDKRNMHLLSAAKDAGWAAWASVFHEEGTLSPDNALQDVSFDQKVSALQAGIQWTGEVGGGRLVAGPVFGYGDARANANANLGSASGDVNSYGLNVSYKLEQGLYVDASWQAMTMETDFRTPGTASGATGQSDADGDGFNVEVGYQYGLPSGLALVPQLQYASVDVELDDFASSDGVYDFTGVGGKASQLRAGVAVLKTFETENGFVTPVANLNYLYSSDGESALRSNGVYFENDASGSGYRAELGIAGRYKAWDITGRVGVTDTSVSDFLLSTNVAVRYRW